MKRSSICTVLVNIPKLVLIVQTWMLTARGVSLRVKVKTAGCSQNCSLISSNYNESKCVSSILINGKEYSHQKDGYNIAIIDNKLGNVSKHHSDYFTKRARKNILPATEKRDWKKFFDDVLDNSTIIVVAQNICANFYKRLYINLQKAGINILYSPKYNFNHNITVFVGCKGSCPDWSSIKIPFSYSGNGKAFKKTFIINIEISSKTIGQGNEPRRPEQYVAETNQNGNGRNGGHMGTILGGIIALAFAICIIAVIYVTNKRPSNSDTLLCCKIRKGTPTPENLRRVHVGKSGITNRMHLLEGEKKDQIIGPTSDHHQRKLSSDELLQSTLDGPNALPTFMDICTPSTICIESAYSSPDKSSHEMHSPERGSPFLCREISKEVSNNDHRHDQRQASSNITSVSSLVDNDCHRSDPALLQPGTSVLTSDSFLNEKRPSRSNSGRRPSRSNSSSRHYRRHSRRSIHRQCSGIGRSESTPDIISEHHCCQQQFHLNSKPLQQKTMIDSFKF